MNGHSHVHKCDHLISTISDYVDGSLSPQLCAELEKHLCECENCTVVVDTLRKTSAWFKPARKTTACPAKSARACFTPSTWTIS